MSSKPGQTNLNAQQGANFDCTFTWSDENNVAIDLTGFTAIMQVREDYDGALLTEFNTTDGSITLGGAAGTIRLEKSAAETQTWSAANYVYDLELTSGAGFVTRLIEGFFIVSPEVTK